MKKLVFVFAAICAISFASCGNKTASTTECDTISTDTIDTLSVDTIDTVDVVL